MRARTAALVLASLAACAGPSSRAGRTPDSPAELARPESDPALRGAPPGAMALLPVEQVSVRVRRDADGRFTLLEFMNPALTEAQRSALRMAFEAGELHLASEPGTGEESWITNLTRSRSR